MLALLAASASFATIPSTVDYWAVQNSVDNWSLVKDKYGFGVPLWADESKLLIHNMSSDLWDKWLWLEVNYQTLPSPLPNPIAQAPESTVTLLGVQVNGNDVTWLWRMDP